MKNKINYLDLEISKSNNLSGEVKQYTQSILKSK